MFCGLCQCRPLTAPWSRSEYRRGFVLLLNTLKRSMSVAQSRQKHINEANRKTTKKSTIRCQMTKTHNAGFSCGEVLRVGWGFESWFFSIDSQPYWFTNLIIGSLDSLDLSNDHSKWLRMSLTCWSLSCCFVQPALGLAHSPSEEE